MMQGTTLGIGGFCMIFDLVLVSNHCGQSGAHRWIREDADNNGEISVLDFVVVANHYGTTWYKKKS
jgi:hypothetical protein